VPHRSRVICGDKNAQDRSVSDFSTMKKSPRRAGLAELIAKRGKIDDYFVKKRAAFPSLVTLSSLLSVWRVGLSSGAKVRISQFRNSRGRLLFPHPQQ